MSRKDYKQLVKILARCDVNFKDHIELIGSLCSWLKEDNTNFCKSTFEDALKDEIKKYRQEGLDNFSRTFESMSLASPNNPYQKGLNNE